MLSIHLQSLMASATLIAAAPTGNSVNPPAFFLAGDSTTAVDGGWGDGLLELLIGPATGLNFGKSGATTASFVNQGRWDNVTAHVTDYVGDYDVYVTISVGIVFSSFRTTGG